MHKDCIAYFVCYLRFILKISLNNSKNKFVLFVAITGTLLAGCATTSKMTLSHTATRLDANASELANIRSMLRAQSLMARSMSVTGDVTIDQNGESNSASFSMKSKRLDANGNRIDSLSIEVLGPFGIKVAKFLASPKQYSFYDMLHDQTMAGPTDSKSLEGLTQLHGISLPMMSDLIYGLASNDVESSDSIRIYSSGESRYILIAQNFNAKVTSALDLDGTVPTDSIAGSLTLIRCRRWNGILDPTTSTASPMLAVRFSEPITVMGVSIPQHIEAAAGGNALTLAYDRTEINPPSLTVKIKMPQ